MDRYEIGIDFLIALFKCNVSRCPRVRVEVLAGCLKKTDNSVTKDTLKKTAVMHFKSTAKQHSVSKMETNILEQMFDFPGSKPATDVFLWSYE